MKPPVILAVDDRQDNLFILKQLIADNFSKCILFTANSGEKGMEIARESSLDVVITDVQMPGMSGIEFCRRLKSLPETADAIVLLLTAHKPKPELVAEGLDAGAFDFISKPVDNLEITARINAALRIKAAEVELQNAHDRLEQKVLDRTADLEAINQQLEKEIDEKETIAKALRETNQLILTAMEGTDEGMWDADLSSGFVTFDENWTKVLGYDGTNRRFGRDWWSEHISEKYLVKIFNAAKDYLAGNEKYLETEYRIKTKQGEWIWVRARGVCVAFDKDNMPLRMIGTQRDITERRKAEEAYQKLVKAIEQVEDVIIITNPEAEIQYVNPSFEKVTGFQCEDVIGENPRILQSGAHEDSLYEKMWQTLTSGETWSGKFINKKKDQSFINIESTITPIKNRQGEIYNYIAVQRDVTKQVKMEQQLRQAQKMEAIGTLAGGIAHDFNNLLFAIQGYNSLSLKLLNESHPVCGHLQKLGQAADRAKDLVAQILTFSRQTDQKLKPIMMQPVVKEAMNLLRATIPTTIEVEQSINPNGALILGNVTHVHQIIINLATNAYQAMKETGGLLTVSLNTIVVDPESDNGYQELAPGNYAELIVSDTGHGMEQATLDRIFEPYFSTKEQGEGTGMGLSIIHGIVSAYNGRIMVESEKGKGTTFKVLIPEIDTSKVNEIKEIPLTDQKLQGSGNILVVDDDDQVSEVLKSMLEELGYHVEAYTCSETLLQVFEQDSNHWDALITDMTMPKMTGAVLASRILSIKPNFPVVLCTGYNDTIDESRAKKMGIREFILKPVSFNDLAITMKKVLSNV